jgi:selenide,water dikinase
MMKLTQTVQKGGCAAKVAAAELRKILQNVSFPPSHPQLMIDGSLFDDAAVYKITSDLAMVQTLDFFTPIVDSPYLFGQIAAANALSDVYAMGGTPTTAMAILAFPLISLPQEVIVQVLQGASDKIKEAKACFVGGHSIDDDTLKFGLSVTGFVHPEKIWSNQGAKEGDILLLTKALGTGTITASLKRQETTEQDIHEALQSMATLNNVKDFLNTTQIQAIHAATDITGFGLAGHGMQMAKASNVSFEIETQKLPLLPRSLEFIEKSFLTKAHRTNREYTEQDVDFSALSKSLQSLAVDPQTSGGLLLSVSADQAESIGQSLKKAFPQTQMIGSVKKSKEKKIYFHG